MLLSTSICATLLALSFCFSKAEADDNRKVIGYRTVAKDLAFIWYKNLPAGLAKSRIGIVLLERILRR
ncbi:uncharacterized protein L3040_007123 [Drepanopeziza brunnea f. sp. 'multigermtubi']|uniref:uncharacterized protein n=1 Tax=Drepanopeziza brunnea f. sp. 'multigermtubi' TaxID=698441 RepID=UPI002386073B|nr:hypothetical protein L3040_007123 [Drepanopeziza brunnea f. sp. 'multigermtubi']